MKTSLSSQIRNAANISELKEVLQDCTIKIGRLGGRYIVKEGTSSGRDVSINTLVKKLHELTLSDEIKSKPTEFQEVLTKIEDLDTKGAQKLTKKGSLKKRLTKLKQYFGSGAYDRAGTLLTINNTIKTLLTSFAPSPLRFSAPTAQPIPAKPRIDDQPPQTPPVSKPHSGPAPATQPILAVTPSPRPTPLTTPKPAASPAKPLDLPPATPAVTPTPRPIPVLSKPHSGPAPATQPIPAKFQPIQNAEEARKHALIPGKFCTDRNGFVQYLMVTPLDKKLFAFCPSSDGKDVRCIIYDPNIKKIEIKKLEENETPKIREESLLKNGYISASILKDFVNYSTIQKNLGDTLNPIEAEFSTHFEDPLESQLQIDDHCLFENQIAKIISINTAAHTAEVKLLQGQATIDLSQLKKLNSTFTPLFIPAPEVVDQNAPNLHEDFTNLFDAADGLHLRSVQSRSFFNQHFSQYNPYQSSINIGSTSQPDVYEMLSGSVIHMSKKKLASCGSTPNREIILMDPDQSPLLNAGYTMLKNILTASLARGEIKTEEEILSAIVDFMRKQVFPSSGDRGLEAKFNAFLDSKRNGKSLVSSDKSLSIPMIKIDEFIEQGIGVCRHHGVVLSYFLDKLSKETPPVINGVTQHMRDNIVNYNGGRGAHVWCTFISKNGTKWHIDSLWNEVIDFSHKSGENRLASLYGQQMKDNQVRKINQTYKAMQDRKMILQAPPATPRIDAPAAPRVDPRVDPLLTPIVIPLGAFPARRSEMSPDEKKFALSSDNFFADREGFKQIILKNQPTEKLIAFCPSEDGKNISLILYDRSTNPQVQYQDLLANYNLKEFYTMLQHKGFKPVNTLPAVFELVSAFQSPKLKINHKLTEIEHGYLTSMRPLNGLKVGDYCIVYGERTVGQVKAIENDIIEILFDGGATIKTNFADLECLIDPAEQKKIINAKSEAANKARAEQQFAQHLEIFQGGNFIPNQEAANALLKRSKNTWVFMPDMMNDSIICRFSDSEGNIMTVKPFPYYSSSSKDFEALIPRGIHKASLSKDQFKSLAKLQIKIGKELNMLEVSYLGDPNPTLKSGDYCVTPIKTSDGTLKMLVEKIISIDKAAQKVTLQTIKGKVTRDLSELIKLNPTRFSTNP